jgi:serine/threonine protein kinase
VGRVQTLTVLDGAPGREGSGPVYRGSDTWGTMYSARNYYYCSRLGNQKGAQEFIRRLLDVNPTTRISLTDALSHPWLSPSVPSGSGGTTACTDIKRKHKALLDRR